MIDILNELEGQIQKLKTERTKCQVRTECLSDEINRLEQLQWSVSSKLAMEEKEDVK